MRRQPFDQPLHLVDGLRLRGAVLLRPAIDLARDIIFAAAEVRKPQTRRVVAMQARQGRHHHVIDRRPLPGIGSRHLGIPEHAALDEAHHIERRAGDAVVGAIEHGLRHRKALGGQRPDDAELAIDRMRRRQKLTGRLPPQHVFARRGFQQVGRVGLAALELVHGQRPGKARNLPRQSGLQARRIEAQRLGHVLGAGKRNLAVDLLHGPNVASPKAAR